MRETKMTDSPKKSRVGGRKRAEDLVTRRNIDAMARYVNLAFRSLDVSLPTVRDPKEAELRKSVYADAAVFLRGAALTYLRERETATFNTIVYSAVVCAREAINTGESNFRLLRRPRGCPARC